MVMAEVIHEYGRSYTDCPLLPTLPGAEQLLDANRCPLRAQRCRFWPVDLGPRGLAWARTPWLCAALLDGEALSAALAQTTGASGGDGALSSTTGGLPTKPSAVRPGMLGQVLRQAHRLCVRLRTELGCSIRGDP